MNKEMASEQHIDHSAPLERDGTVERWLREDVAPAYDAMKADPSRGIPADEVFAALHMRHIQRLKDSA